MGPHVEDIPAEMNENVLPKEEKREIIETVKEDVDETVILARLRTQAKVLQELDGELPESVDKFLSNLDKKEKVPSLSLVAGYGEESEEEDEDEDEIEENQDAIPKTLFPIPDTNSNIENATGESTLFPITQPIDINQFGVVSTTAEEKPPPPPSSQQNSTDTKIFKRKKRIAFDVLPSVPDKKQKPDETDERRGFGFKTDTDDGQKYLNFKKGGVAFIKSDENIAPTIIEIKTENLDETKAVVGEKLEFLCEGKNDVSAVQVMSIQLNVSSFLTLYLSMARIPKC